MDINGVYGFVYCGANGIGMGAFVVKDDHVVGHDLGGGKYDGSATVNGDGTIDLDIIMRVAPGTELVQGTSAQELPYERPTRHRCPPGFGDGEPMRVQAQPGEVIVMVKRIPDELKTPPEMASPWSRVVYLNCRLHRHARAPIYFFEKSESPTASSGAILRRPASGGVHAYEIIFVPTRININPAASLSLLKIELRGVTRT